MTASPNMRAAGSGGNPSRRAATPAGGLNVPCLGEKQCVWKANSAALQNPGLGLARGQASYWL